MSMAFGISEDDVLVIASQAGVELAGERASEILGMLDHDLIEAAALHYDDMDEQTESAYDEIRRQLGELGLADEVLGPSASKARAPSP